jgi:hypothetical protein
VPFYDLWHWHGSFELRNAEFVDLLSGFVREALLRRSFFILILYVVLVVQYFWLV